MSIVRIPGGGIRREPGSISDFAVASQATVVPISYGTVLVLAESEAGVPIRSGGVVNPAAPVYDFRSYDEARAVLVGGAGLALLKNVFRPSSTFTGAPRARFVRTQDATASGIELLDAYPAGGVGISVVSKLYGSRAALLRANVTAGVGEERTVHIHFDADGDGELDVGELVESFGPFTTNAELVAAINDAIKGSDLITAALGPGGLIAAAPAGYVSFSGGTESAMTGTDVAEALAHTRALPKNFVLSGFENAAWQADVQAYCLDREGGSEQPCLQFCGQGTGLDAAAAKAAAGAFDSDRTVFCWPGLYDWNEAGTDTVLLSSMYHAAKICGLVAGLSPQRPPTRKPILAQGLEVTADHPLGRSEREALLDAGVCFTSDDPEGRYVVWQGLTTLQDNDQSWSRQANASSEISLTRVRDILMYEPAKTADAIFVGEDKGQYPPAAIEAFMADYLNRKVADQLIRGWGGLEVKDVADRYEVTFGYDDNPPINFFVNKVRATG